MGSANERERDDEITELSYPTRCRAAARSIELLLDRPGCAIARHVSLT